LFKEKPKSSILVNSNDIFKFWSRSKH
jgi:hypothetical protein